MTIQGVIDASKRVIHDTRRWVREILRGKWGRGRKNLLHPTCVTFALRDGSVRRACEERGFCPGHLCNDEWQCEGRRKKFPLFYKKGLLHPKSSPSFCASFKEP